MSRNLIIALVVGALVVVGGAAYFMTQSDSDTDSTTNTSQSAETSTEDTDASAFNPSNTLEQDFVATLATTGEGQSLEAELQYDVDGKVWRYVSTVSDQEMEIIVTEDAYYSKADGQWTKLPVSGDTGTGFDPDAYELTDEEIADFQQSSNYKGEASCPAGTCDLWEIDGDEGTGKISFYVEKQNNTINQMISETNGSTTTITYNYEDVTIEIPTDAQEVPSLGQ